MSDFAINGGSHYGLSTTTVTGTTLSGSLVSLEHKKTITVNEFADGNEDFILVAMNKKVDEIAFEMIVTATGNTTSASILMVEPGSSLTLNDSTYADVTGSWRITDIGSKRAVGELAHYQGTAKRWKGANGWFS